MAMVGLIASARTGTFDFLAWANKTGCICTWCVVTIIISALLSIVILTSHLTKQPRFFMYDHEEIYGCCTSEKTHKPNSHNWLVSWFTDSSGDYSLLVRLFEGPLLFVRRNFYSTKILTISWSGGTCSIDWTNLVDRTYDKVPHFSHRLKHFEK